MIYINMKKKSLKTGKNKKIKGIWFYGMSGVGKSYASKVLSKKFISDCIIIDGDEVRKYVSFDLGYDLKNRLIQLERIFGISKIAIKSNIFPIVSCVYMTNKMYKLAEKEKIKVVKISRDEEKIKEFKIYKKNKKNIVGLDIGYEKFKTNIIHNCGTNKFKKKILLMMDHYFNSV